MPDKRNNAQQERDSSEDSVADDVRGVGRDVAQTAGDVAGLGAGLLSELAGTLDGLVDGLIGDPFGRRRTQIHPWELPATPSFRGLIHELNELNIRKQEIHVGVGSR